MAITHASDHVAPEVVRLRHLFVNVYLIGDKDRWMLVDAALPGAADEIVALAEERFGAGARPAGILLTHGHFDHVGALKTLVERWDVPVYASDREMPHLTGREDYPAPDPTVGKGALALMSFAFPHKAFDFGKAVRPLPADGSVPELPDWRWLATPGHSDGHVSFFRDADRCLVAGDAFVTVKQESLYAVATQEEELHGPPAYFTPDWIAARESVRRLAALDPAVAATGHGTPMTGERLRAGLQHLAQAFDRVAVPQHGRYVPPEAELERGAPDV